MAAAMQEKEQILHAMVKGEIKPDPGLTMLNYLGIGANTANQPPELQALLATLDGLCSNIKSMGENNNAGEACKQAEKSQVHNNTQPENATSAEAKAQTEQEQ